MTISVRSSAGHVVAFPDGTDAATITKVMDQAMRGGAAGQLARGDVPAAAALPDGFMLDPAPASTGLPAGFTLDPPVGP